MLSERESLIALSSVPGLTAKKIVEAKAVLGSAQKLWHSRPAQWTTLHISGALKKAFAKTQACFSLSHFQSILQQHEIDVITIEDDEYPQSLRELFDPPQVLYIRGQLKLNYAPNLAVVGSRKRTVYGENALNQLLPPVIQQGATIISGMALGIDSDAHRCALANNGYTIAVLGNGVDFAYPSCNARLMKEIIAKGAVISEYPPGFEPRKWTFPARNRIIAGLCDAVWVVEAGEKSGSLITADFAMELGKEVLSLPGNIYNHLSAGTNKLIQQGAKIILSSQDILEELFDNNTKIEMQAPQQLHLLTPADEKVFACLSQKPRHIDDIINESGLPAAQVLATLTIFSLQGVVKEYEGKLFSLKI